MDDINAIRKKLRQKKYLKKRNHEGLTRMEFFVRENIKTQFMQMVEDVAEEFASPWDPRQRQAKAKTRLFEDMIQGTKHEFFELKDKILSLREEIKALSPSFFKSGAPDHTPLPEAINALPDDANQLKQLLAKIYRDSQQARRSANEYKRRSEQFEKLYEASNNYNDQLRARLEQEGLFVESSQEI